MDEDEYFQGIRWPESLALCGQALWKRNLVFFKVCEAPVSYAAESNRKQQSAEHATQIWEQDRQLEKKKKSDKNKS